MAHSCSESVAVLPSCGKTSVHSVLSESAGSPFFHKFQTNRGKYIFDTNTRRILKVTDVVWEVLDYCGQGNDEEIIRERGSRYGQEVIRSALAEIRDAQQSGLLLIRRPQNVVPPSRKFVEERLGNSREHLILGVTEECNFRCKYCVYSGNDPQQRPHSSRSMNWEVAKAAMDDFLAHSRLSKNRTISFYGGEPLLNLPLIQHCVQYAKENVSGSAIMFAMTTNGYLLQGEAADFLAANAFVVTVSLDGPQGSHDRNRRTQNDSPTWGKVMDNLRSFLARHPQYGANGRLRFNAVADSAADLCQCQSFFACSDLFSDSMGLQVSLEKRVDEAGSLQAHDPLAITASQLQKEFLAKLIRGEFGDRHTCRENWLQASLFGRSYLLFHKRKYIRPHLPEKLTFLNTCLPGQRRTFADVDGNYYSCERVPLTQEQRLGDCFEGLSVEKVMSLLELWNRSAGDQCRHCWSVSNCTVGCFASVGNSRGITAEAMSAACRLQRQELHNLLVSYCSILEENSHAFDYTAQISVE